MIIKYGRDRRFCRQNEQDSAFGTMHYQDPMYRLHVMLEFIVLDRNLRFTSGIWRHKFEYLGSLLHISPADHPQADD